MTKSNTYEKAQMIQNASLPPFVYFKTGPFVRNSPHWCKLQHSPFISYSKEKDLYPKRNYGTRGGSQKLRPSGRLKPVCAHESGRRSPTAMPVRTEASGQLRGPRIRFLPPHGSKEGTQGRGALPGKELPPLLTKTVLSFPTKLDHWLVSFPLHSEAPGKVRNGFQSGETVPGERSFPHWDRPPPHIHAAGVSATLHPLRASYILPRCHRATAGPTMEPFLVFMPLCSPFPSLWVWDDLVTCFSQENVAVLSQNSPWVSSRCLKNGMLTRRNILRHVCKTCRQRAELPSELSHLLVILQTFPSLNRYC